MLGVFIPGNSVNLGADNALVKIHRGRCRRAGVSGLVDTLLGPCADPIMARAKLTGGAGGVELVA